MINSQSCIMTKWLIPVICLVIGLILVESCNMKSNEALARQHCSSCHAFPEPSLLPKSIWLQSVLPQMAFRMGLDKSNLYTINPMDRKAVLSTLPETPMVNYKEWVKILKYYRDNAPDSIVFDASEIKDTLRQFHPMTVAFQDKADRFVTMVNYDSQNKKAFIGTRNGSIFELKPSLKLQKMMDAKNPVSQLLSIADKKLVLTMGIMNPNDHALGKLLSFQHNTIQQVLLDSLKRPVHFNVMDLNQDQLDDVVVCEFGDYTGELSAFKNMGNETFEKNGILKMPGARKTEFVDWDANGTTDFVALVSQGDEKLILVKNKGNFNFEIETLLRFPSVYGSSYFELQDMNQDGAVDIIYTNGDNADYSIVLKPYHGIRIFLNDGKGKFNESWFYPNPGASQVRVRDFDGDGDQDIASISFFPDFNHYPERGFIYFENNKGIFKPSVTPMGGMGRWITMEACDYDSDGDDDILLGALNFTLSLPVTLQEKWKENPVDILVLENQTKK